MFVFPGSVSITCPRTGLATELTKVSGLMWFYANFQSLCWSRIWRRIFILLTTARKVFFCLFLEVLLKLKTSQHRLYHETDYKLCAHFLHWAHKPTSSHIYDSHHESGAIWEVKYLLGKQPGTAQSLRHHAQIWPPSAESLGDRVV